MQKRLLNKIRQTYPTLMAGVEDIKLHNARIDGETTKLAAIIYKDGTLKNLPFKDAAEFKAKCKQWEKDLNA